MIKVSPGATRADSCLSAHDEREIEGPSKDGRVRCLAPVIGGQAHDTGAPEQEGIERRQVDAHRHRPGGRTFAWARFRQFQQSAQQAVADGIDVADAVAKVGVVEISKNGADHVQGAADRPRCPEVLRADEASDLIEQIPALEHEPMRFQNLAALSGMAAHQLLLQPLELLIGSGEGPVESGQLGLDLVSRYPRLPDRDRHVQRIGGTDHDSVRRPDSLEPLHAHATLSRQAYAPQQREAGTFGLSAQPRRNSASSSGSAQRATATP